MRTCSAAAVLAALACLGPYLWGCGSQTEAKIPESAELLLKAKQAIADGDETAALAALNESITSQPTTWALIERAKLHARRGDDEDARADCQQLRQLDPETHDAAWIEGELKKPTAERFKGAAATAPSLRK